MSIFLTIAPFCGLALVLYSLGSMRARSIAARHAGDGFHSRPGYHGAYTGILTLGPVLLVLAFGALAEMVVAPSLALNSIDPSMLVDAASQKRLIKDAIATAEGRFFGTPGAAVAALAATYSQIAGKFQIATYVAAGITGLLGLIIALRSIGAKFRARNRVERFVTILLLACAGVAVLTTIGIVFSVLFESLRFFQRVAPLDFLTGLQWSPQTAIRAEQGGSSGSFGIVPLLVGTILISSIAILIAGPIGLFAAIYMAEYASPRLRSIAKPVLEILAGIPTVVLGFFAALTVAPLIRGWGEALGLSVASESALAAGLVMGMMIIPFVSSLSDDVITAVPNSLRDGSLGLGATQSETIRQVVLPAALPGIVSAFMLAISRAIGETMIVVMAAGLAAKLSFNPLDAVTTVTVQIKTILVGDQEFDSAKTLAAFALGLVLFFFTLVLNVVSMIIIRKFRERYD